MTFEKLSKNLSILTNKLTYEEIEAAANLLLDESISVDKKANFLMLLNKRDIYSSEIAFFVRAFLKRSRKIKLSEKSKKLPKIDVCGTGGDKLDLFNISTATIFILAAGGLLVLKHGNRGVTSKSGGADVLEAMGINIDLEPDELSRCIDKCGIGFIFAQKYHPAFKAVAPVRKFLAEQGEKTIFNILGPLLNPLQPEFQLAGVFDEKLVGKFAKVFKILGRKAAIIVYGKAADSRGVDEFSTMGENFFTHLNQGGEISKKMLNPQDLGLKLARIDDLRGADSEKNARILEDIISGKEQGAKREIVMLNAAAGFVCSGIKKNFTSGLEYADYLLKSGLALKKLEEIRNFFNNYANNG